MSPIIRITGLSKVYDGGVTALSDVSLDVGAGEIIALLGPNGAGKTTLISAVCGLASPSAGTIRVGGFDIARDWRSARKMIGLVPQEISLELFESVIATVRFSRGLFGCPPDEAYLERTLRALSLWDKRDAQNMALSGGMKRRVLIAKALAHEPRVLFLDEPTAGVDVTLRREMWELIERLRAKGVTIVLTTHYIEEAERMADRIGVIDQGRLLLVDETAALMRRMGRKSLRLALQAPLERVPEALCAYALTLEDAGHTLVYDYDTQAARTGITRMIADLAEHGISVRDLESRQSSLEEVFLSLLDREAR